MAYNMIFSFLILFGAIPVYDSGLTFAKSHGSDGHSSSRLFHLDVSNVIAG